MKNIKIGLYFKPFYKKFEKGKSLSRDDKEIKNAIFAQKRQLELMHGKGMDPWKPCQVCKKFEMTIQSRIKVS